MPFRADQARKWQQKAFPEGRGKSHEQQTGSCFRKPKRRFLQQGKGQENTWQTGVQSCYVQGLGMPPVGSLSSGSIYYGCPVPAHHWMLNVEGEAAR